MKTQRSNLSPTRPYRLAVVICAPEPYHARLLQVLGQHPSIDLTVYYESDRTIVGALNPGFGVPVFLDRSVLDGYRAEFLLSYKEGLSRLEELAAYLQIIPKLRRGNYDAVFIHSYATLLSIFAYVGAWISRTPAMQRSESELLRPRRWWVALIKKLYLSVMLRGTSAFLVVGTANREFYTYYGVEKRKMFHAPYSVNNDFFAEQAAQLLPKHAQLKQSLGFESDLPIIVYSAKLIPRKRPMDLLEAYRQLLAEGLRAGLLFIGDGELRGELENAIQSHQLSAVKITGFKNQNELPPLYACGDIFVLPSQFDPWGVVVNEGMLFGMPAIVTDMVGSGLDLVEPNVTGYIYQVGDVARLTELLASLLRDPDKRAEMGKTAKQRVTGWNEHVAADGILQALRSLKSDPFK